MKRNGFAALCLFLATGCGDPSGVAGLTGAEGELAATFDGGKRFSARGECREGPTPPCASAAIYHHPEFGTGVSINGIIVSGDRYEQFALSVSAPEKGTYMFREGCDRCAFVNYQTGDWPGSSTIYRGPPNSWDPVSATVTVTDAGNGRLRGTFNAVLTSTVLPQLEVREGRFDVPLRTQ